VASGGKVRIGSTTQLKARAWKDGWLESLTTEAVYSLPSTRVSISYPPDWTVQEVTTTRVDLAASTLDGLARVEWFKDGISVGTNVFATAVNVWSNSFVWSGLAFGTNVLTAVATDQAGCATTSTPVRVIVEKTRRLVLGGDLDFGPVTVGQRAERMLTLRNDGNSFVVVTSVVATAGFSVVNKTIGLPAGASTNVTVTFSPTAVQAYAGELTVLHTPLFTHGTNKYACAGIGTPSVPLQEALDNSELNWQTGGDAEWFGQVNESRDGVDAAQSGAVGDGQTSWMQTTAAGPGSVSFVWKVSSESGGDFLRFFIDGVEQAGSISGETGWTRKSYALPDRTCTVKWSYEKNASGSAGDDCGWVDQVVVSHGVAFEQAFVVTDGEGLTGTNAFIAVVPVFGVGPASVPVYVLPGSAGTSDYVAPRYPVVLTWADGETGTKNVTVPIKGDRYVEGDEVFYLALGTPTAGELGELRVCTVMIADDDVGTVSDKGVYVTGLPQPPDGGSVSGAKWCVADRSVKLSARAKSGWTFLNWDDGSQAASRTVTYDEAAGAAQDNVMLCTASFKRTADVAPLTVENPGPQEAMVGVAFALPLGVDSECLPKVKVTGLPSGLKFDANAVAITGAPLKPGTFNVTFTASNPAGAAAPQVFTITVTPLPAWAWGVFNGAAGSDDMGEGLASLSVTALGKGTGKISLRGSNFTFSAASFAERDGAEVFLMTAEAKVGKSVLPVDLWVYAPEITDASGAVPATLGKADGIIGADESGWLTLYRDVWTDAGMADVITNWTGYYTATLPGEGCGSGYLTFTVDKNGRVKTAGKLADGAAVSLSGSLILDETGRVFAVLYTAPSAYKGGSLFGIAEFVKPEAGPAVVRLLGGTPFAWSSLNPLATGEYGEGFARELGLSGGWYDKLINLRGYYENGLTVGGMDLPSLTASVKFTDWNEDGTRKVSWTEYGLVDAAGDATPAGLVLSVTPVTGVGTGFSAPRADTPARDAETGEYDYFADSDGDGVSNTAGLSFRFTRATGLFSGTFKTWYDYISAEDYATDTLKQTHMSKTVTFQGALTPVREEGGAEGRGYFLWKDASEYDTGRLDSYGEPVMKAYSFNGSFDFLLLGE
jgi:hypothetical protein